MVGEPDLISWETLSAYFSENISVTNQNTYQFAIFTMWRHIDKILQIE